MEVLSGAKAQEADDISQTVDKDLGKENDQVHDTESSDNEERDIDEENSHVHSEEENIIVENDLEIQELWISFFWRRGRYRKWIVDQYPFHLPKIKLFDIISMQCNAMQLCVVLVYTYVVPISADVVLMCTKVVLMLNNVVLTCAIVVLI